MKGKKCNHSVWQSGGFIRGGVVCSLCGKWFLKLKDMEDDYLKIDKNEEWYYDDKTEIARLDDTFNILSTILHGRELENGDWQYAIVSWYATSPIVHISFTRNKIIKKF